MMGIVRNQKFLDVIRLPFTISSYLELWHANNFHSSCCFYAVDKALLSQLRKKTGFPLNHCKNALELNEHDLEKSEQWLQKEAQAHGWARAMKLSGRAATQGLIGIHIEKNVGGLVEVNCETDFVAKNQDFKNLVYVVAKLFTLAPSSHSGTQETPTREYIGKDILEKIKNEEGSTLSDLVALTVGKVGENILLTRGVKFTAPPDSELAGYTHPPSEDGKLVGKYAALVALKNIQDEVLKRELCAHIIGMKPSELGTPAEANDPTTERTSDEASKIKSSDSSPAKSPDPPAERTIDESPKKEPSDSSSSSSSSSEDDDSSDEADAPREEKFERMLLRQMFIGDEDRTVAEVLQENNVEIVDFVRLECGETQKDIGK